MNKLLYASSRDTLDEAQVIYQSSEGIPVGWFVLFGGRNFCEPDQKISERGGTSASRDRWITPMEVAEARLGNAIEAFSESEHLWPWFSALKIMHRKSLTLGKNGVFQLDAPELLKDPDKLERLGQAPAIVENVVNCLISERYGSISKLLKSVDDFVPFVSWFDDKDKVRFFKLVHAREAEPVHLAGELCLGLPTENQDRFFSILEKDCMESVDAIPGLPKIPDVEEESLSSVSVAKEPVSPPAEKKSTQESKSDEKKEQPPATVKTAVPPPQKVAEPEPAPGLFGKIMGIFKKS